MTDAGLILTILSEHPAGVSTAGLRTLSRLSATRLKAALTELQDTGAAMHRYQRYLHAQFVDTIVAHHAEQILAVLSTEALSYRKLCQTAKVDGQIASSAIALLETRGDAHRLIVGKTSYWTAARARTILIPDATLDLVCQILGRARNGTMASASSVRDAGLTKDAFITAAALLTERGQVETTWLTNGTHRYAIYRLASRTSTVITPAVLPAAAPDLAPPAPIRAPQRTPRRPVRQARPTVVSRPMVRRQPRQPLTLTPRPRLAPRPAGMLGVPTWLSDPGPVTPQQGRAAPTMPLLSHSPGTPLHRSSPLGLARSAIRRAGACEPPNLTLTDPGRPRGHIPPEHLHPESRKAA